MSPRLLFTLTLLMGIGFLYVGKKLKEKIKLVFLLMGIGFVLFGGFGVFTSLL
ncbi:MAG: hypothetical protein Q4F05_14535 [bacterium]|nr:hypothetical protein [bacterium]